MNTTTEIAPASCFSQSIPFALPAKGVLLTPASHFWGWARRGRDFVYIWLGVVLASQSHAQTLLDVDFGVGSRSPKVGFAATGQGTNGFWNLYRHYDPKFVPGRPLVANGTLKDLKLADGAETKVSVSVNNAPGVWGNTSGDPMFDTYLFAPNGSNITVTVKHLEAGRYHIYLYGHADPDVTGEQNSSFSVHSATNTYGPLATLSASGWKATSPWQERYQYVVFRDVQVVAGKPIVIDVVPGANGVAVLNGMQIISRGTSPPGLASAVAARPPATLTNLIFREINYDGKVTDTEARFIVDLQVESLTTNEISAPLFEGDVAVVAPEIPVGLRIVSAARKYYLLAAAPGAHHFRLELLAKITKAEPWNQISFVGPSAAIASVTAEAATPGLEMQLLTGTQVETRTAVSPASLSRLTGFLGADRTLSLRWQSKAAEVTRKSLVTVDTVASAQITPTVIKFSTQLHYEILQASVPKLTIALPANHALTKLQGEQIRDWNVKPDAGRQLLTVEFIRPVEKNYTLALFSEQGVAAAPLTAQIVPPQPLDIEREAGSFGISTDDMLVEIDSATGLRQVNAAAGTLAAYRFYGRPFALAARLKRIEPVLKVTDRVSSRLEESRLLVSHSLTLTVEKAGLYSVELAPQAGFVVADVRGEGVDDWKVADGKVRVSFASRVLGTRQLDVQLEQAQKTFPSQITIAALRVISATNETARIGAASALGIRLKTAGARAGLREVPIESLASRSDELLAYAADQGDWQLTLAAEKLPARVVADVFNLITIGDGLIGGSATIRYGLINQGVQEFKIKLPTHWKNVEFTGPNIRRKETNAPGLNGATDTNFVVWTLSLQDKAWGGYTLVVTYDYQFDPKNASLNLGGAHAEAVERETGSVAITTAASLKLEPKSPSAPLRVIDQFELTETDRALITRPVLLAYRYVGDDFQLDAEVTRHEELRVLDAVADRTQITSVITDEGQMLTQASFMVKNNDRQFQRFQLPKGAKLWGCYVNNEPVKGELDGGWLLVPLPRGANRNEAFGVDIKYEERIDALKARLFPRTIELKAPKTDVSNTYAEWQVFVPPAQRLSGFGGNMTVAREYEPYTLREAWNIFVDCYTAILRESGRTIAMIVVVAALLAGVVGAAVRSGKRGVLTVLAAFAILAILAGMMLPALSRAKARASRIDAVSNLKQIGLAALLFANEHGERFPNSLEEMKNELGGERVLIDPETGMRMVYVGAGKRTDNPRAILAYSPNGRAICLADGSVLQTSSEQFTEALRRDAAIANSLSIAQVAEMQKNAVRQQQAVTMSGYADRGSRAGTVDSATGLPIPAAGPAPAAPPMNVSGSAITPLMEPAKAAEKDDLKTQDRLLVQDQAKPVADGKTTSLDTSPRKPERGVALGAFGFGSGGGMAPLAPAGALAPTASGLRSIRIDVPRTGQLFKFTKVLHVSDAPLAVKMSAMKRKWFKTERAAIQICFFITGLIMAWFQWHRSPRSSFWIALGLALMIGSVSNLLIGLQALHAALIVALPLLLLSLLFWFAWRFWPRKSGYASDPAPAAKESATLPTGPAGASSAPPTLAILAFTIFLAQTRVAFAAEDQAAVRNSASDITNSFSIVSATYAGSVREKVGRFDATIQIATFATNQTVPLFGEDVAIEQFSTGAKDAKLFRQGNAVAVRLANSGHATLQVKLIVKLGGDVTKRQLAFGIPPALTSKLAMTIDEAEAGVEFPTAISFQRAPAKTETRIEAVLGAGDRVEMFWTPRVKRVAEMAASIFANSATLVTVGGGAINTRATIEYQVAQGELSQAKVRLPAGQRLLRVEGEMIRTWKLTHEGTDEILAVDLVKAASPSYRLTLELEKVLDQLPAQVQIQVPHALDVIREYGLIGLCGGEELSLSIDHAQDLQRVDAAEFAKANPQSNEGLVSAYRFLTTEFQLTARVEAIQPQIEAVVRNAIHIGFEQITVSAQIDYTIKKAGLFSLRLTPPDGYVIESVTGKNLSEWTEKSEPRLIDVTLKERTMGAFTLRVGLVKTQKELPKTVDLAGMQPLGTQKLTGFVSVTAEQGVAVKSTAFDGLTEIPATLLEPEAATSSARRAAAETAAPRSSSLLAYKFISTNPAGAAWKLNVAAEIIDSWVRAEIVNLVSVSETLLSGRTIIRYDVQNAPVKEFRVKVPAACTNVEFLGNNLRRRDQSGEEWRIELQSKVRGAYTLGLTWEQPRDGRTNAAVEVPVMAALGVERETGSVALLAKPPLQILETSASEQLARIDVRELPEWAGLVASSPSAAAEVPVLVYRYLRPGYRLVLEAKRFDDAAVLQALADSARLTTVVADDGQTMTEMALQVRNNGRQYLEVALPPNSEVWSALVGGQPVRPSKRAAKLLLPLERSGADESPIPVELTFVSRDRFPRTKGEINLVSPQLDVPLKNARWELYLPPDYAYSKFAGSMTHEADESPVVQVYSSSEYFKQESEKQAARQSEMRSVLSNARKGLASGKLKSASDEYSQALRLNGPQDEETKKELAGLKQELGRVQSSNLIQAQRAYTIENVNKYGNLSRLPTSTQGGHEGQEAAAQVQYDADVAEMQWGALQRAQDVPVAKLQALRANLPLRGQRHLFSQVLQTEIDKPMTIRFSAATTKETGWFKNAIYSAAGFLMLWIFVGAVAKRPATKKAARTAA